MGESQYYQNGTLSGVVTAETPEALRKRAKALDKQAKAQAKADKARKAEEAAREADFAIARATYRHVAQSYSFTGAERIEAADRLANGF